MTSGYGMKAWMANDEWYTIDKKRKIFVLTDKAPEEVKESYNEYLKYLKSGRR